MTKQFHHIIARILFLCKQGCPDIQTAVAFLTTQLKAPDQDDYKTFQRAVRYIQATKEIMLTLDASNSGEIMWWVDVTFAVHNDMKSNTGGMLSLGKGSIYAMSKNKS